QDYPDDFQYEGGPPIPPYDNAGYTLAFQMGVEFDRILNDIDGPFEEIEGFAEPMEGEILNQENSKGFLLDHAINDAATVTNRLLAANQKVYWLDQAFEANDKTWDRGTIYIPSTRRSSEIIEKAAGELGINFAGVKEVPATGKIRINDIRIGLWDRYGGSMQSGWTRFILEQFEFPFEKVFPKRLDRGNLSKDFDVLVFVSGAIPSGESRRYSWNSYDESDIPAEYLDWLGSVTKEKTIPQLLEFLRDGGTIIAIGSSTSLAYHAELPVSNHITDSEGKQLGRESYFIPSSVLQVKLDNTLPVGWGMNDRIDIFFHNSPVFRLKPDADKNGITPVAWFDSDRPLRSGWAWGQDRLYGGTAMAKAEVGKGNLYLFGPEILFRAQSHGTYRLFFNSLYLATSVKE
ncbi:MAG TPA: peptidase, partial [Bacteroidales bacterium]|nr:peptidase [Bacteroidales bacterium]